MFKTMTALGTSLSIAVALPAASFADPGLRRTTEKLIIRFDAEGLRRHGHAKPLQSLPEYRVDGDALRMVRRFNGNGMVVRLPNRVTPERARQIADHVAGMAGIAAAQPDKRLYRALVPNDPYYATGPQALGGPGQWYLFEDTAGIRAQDAWDRAKGSPSVVIAQMDTGILSHQDLNPQRVLHEYGYDFISDAETANDGDGRDPDPTDPGDWAEATDECYDPNEPEVNQSSWHGLSVAGVMVAEADNGIDIAGIDFAARLVPVRVLGTCGGLLSDVADAIRWAVGLPVENVPLNPTPANIVNLSLSGEGPCSAEEQAAIDDAVRLGAAVVVAAGNQGADVANFSPANCNNVITVGAVDRAGARTSYMNFGEEVDLSAPGGAGGDGILTLYNTGTTAPGGEALAYIQGTSFPTAQVSAAAALMLSVDNTLTPGMLAQLLRATARPFPDLSCNPLLCGAGILDAAAAVAAAADPSSVLSANTDAGGNDSGGGCSLRRKPTRPDASLLFLLFLSGVSRLLGHGLRLASSALTCSRW